jgi:uncharacterized membrane protein HdeD (DUF308 family)
MNKFVKSLLITSGLNALCFALGFLDPSFFFIFLLLAVIEFLGGLVMLINPDSRQTAAGITFLIGLSICSSSSFDIH